MTMIGVTTNATPTRHWRTTAVQNSKITPYLVQNELVLGHGFDDGVLDLIVLVKNDVFESVDLVDGTRRVGQRVVGPTNHRRPALDTRHHDVRRIRPEDPGGRRGERRV